MSISPQILAQVYSVPLMSQCLILSAGRQTRMQFPDDQPKQLLKVGEETLQARQLRQLSNLGIYPVIVTRNPALQAQAPAYCEPEHTSSILHTLDSSSHLWPREPSNARTIILLGDVYYSDAVLGDIATASSAIRFWFRGAEIFAFSFCAISIPRIFAAIDHCMATGERIYRGVKSHPDFHLWHLLRALSGLNIHQHVPILSELTLPEVTDITTDFDSHTAYADFISQHPDLHAAPRT